MTETLQDKIDALGKPCVYCNSIEETNKAIQELREEIALIRKSYTENTQGHELESNQSLFIIDTILSLIGEKK